MNKLTPLIKQYWLKGLLILTSLLILVICSYLARGQALSLSFVDEQDNFVIGSYLLQGDKLYKDLFSHHQPLPYYISAGIQEVSNPDSLYLLVKRHREFMIGWTILWTIILLFRFGIRSAPFLIAIESTKWLLFGTMFLAESLVIYPLSFCLFLAFEKKLTIRDGILSGIILGGLPFLILPLAPEVLILFFILVANLRKERQKLLWMIGGVISIPLILLLSTSVSDYVYQTLVINMKYYIPNAEGGVDILRSLASPFLVFLPGGSLTITRMIIMTASIIILIHLVTLMKKKNYAGMLLIILLLMVANIRFSQPGVESYGSFHLLPWYTVLLSLASLLGVTYLLKNGTSFGKRVVGVLFVVMIGISMFSLVRQVQSQTPEKEAYYINYSQKFDNGRAIAVLQKPKNTLFVAPIEPLVYWEAKAKPASKYLYYYSWMHQTPPIREEVAHVFRTDPPDFIYCHCGLTGIEQYLTKYHQLSKDKKKTGVYLRKDKVSSLSKDQIEQLEYYRFRL